MEKNSCCLFNLTSNCSYLDINISVVFRNRSDVVDLGGDGRLATEGAPDCHMTAVGVGGWVALEERQDTVQAVGMATGEHTPLHV